MTEVRAKKALGSISSQTRRWPAPLLTPFTAAFLSQPVFSQRPEQLSVEDFVALTNLLA